MHTQLIVALDFDNRADPLTLIDELDPSQCILKVGSELFTRLGPDFVRELVCREFKIFLDLKFHDIPHTVVRACHASADLGVWMLNVHASGGLEMMRAARQALDGYNIRPLLIAVTVLTSMNPEALASVGVSSTLDKQVLNLAMLAKEAGLDGVVCSAHEVPFIKSHCGRDFLAVTPGIRMGSDEPDDQSRIITPEAAIQAGSDFLVIGRPITRSKNPKQVVSNLIMSCLHS